MSEKAREILREMQRRFEEDAARVTTRADLIRLRMYWNDVETALHVDTDPETE